MLPVYVADRYEGYRAVPYAELDDEAVERYIEANVSAVRRWSRRPARTWRWPTTW